MSAVVQDLARAAAVAAGPAVRLIRDDAVALEPVRWLWPGFLPAAMLTILGGAPGCGKTTIAPSLAATVTSGGTWPCRSARNAPGDVVIWSGEDGHAVLAARLVAMGADMQRVHFIDGITGSEGEAFDPGRDMPMLEATAERLAAPRLRTPRAHFGLLNAPWPVSATQASAAVMVSRNATDNGLKPKPPPNQRRDK